MMKRYKAKWEKKKKKGRVSKQTENNEERQSVPENLMLKLRMSCRNHLCKWRRKAASLVAQRLKHLPARQKTWVRSLGWEDPLEKEMATHSSILAWRIPWMEEPGGLQSTGLQRVGHDWATSLSLSYLGKSEQDWSMQKVRMCMTRRSVRSWLIWGLE